MSDREMEALNQKIDGITGKLDALATAIEKRFDSMDGRFEAVDKRLDEIDTGFQRIEREFNDVASQFAEQRAYTGSAFYTVRVDMQAGFAGVNGRLDGTTERLDLFLATQGDINQHHEARLATLERKRRRS